MAPSPNSTGDPDPVRLLNQIFTTPESLDNLDQARAFVGMTADYLQLQLAERAVQTPSQVKAYEAALAAPQGLADLTQDIRNVQELGSNARREISAMTADIQRLDRTKDNLVQSITMIKRLQMLTKLYTQLDSLLKARQYPEIARAVAAAAELTSYFRPFRSVKQVAELSRQVGALEDRIYAQIDEDIKSVVLGKPDPSNGGLMMAGKALDALPSGQKTKDSLIKWYCSTLLSEYSEVFRVGDEAGSLENIARRYAFLKKVIQRYSEHERIFTPEWQVRLHLTRYACERTRTDIETLSSQFRQRQNSHGADDVQLLLNALHETTEFEKYLVRTTGTKEFESAISPAFVSHLNIWVEYQDRQLAQRMERYRMNPAQASTEGEDATSDDSEVLQSSADLFIVYRQSLAQMAKVSNGEPLYQLSRVFAKWLTNYGQSVLRNFIPPTLANGSDIVPVARVLKTADYCITTVRQLEETIIEQIADKYKEKIEFENQQECFLEIVNLALSSLASFVDNTIEPSWREMSNSNWFRINHVGDQSGYVSHLILSIRNSSKAVLEPVTKLSHSRLLSDKIVDSVCVSFVSTAMKVRPMPEVAAEQMLLDLYVIKGALLEVLSFAPSAQDKTDKLDSFKQNTVRVVERVEAVFKVLLTRAEPAEMLVQNYLLLIKDRSVANFRKILEVKGARNTIRLVEIFREKATDPELANESPLLAQISISRTTTRPINSPTIGHSLFERGDQNGNGGGVFKFNENFRKIGDLLRRDSPQSPVRN